jgi:molybdopterin-guanine dinucleotide biosynthesis protein A
MADTVLIMAAGASSRFGQLPFKQLVEVNGETIIGRQVRMVRARGAEPVVVTGHSVIRQAVPCATYAPQGSRWLTESILNTMEWWLGSVAVLLGDVWYTDETLDAVLSCARPLCMFGNQHEIFAITFTDHMLMRKQLEALVGQGLGKLWHLFRHIHGYPMHENTCPNGHDDTFQWITDDTQDVDTRDEYRELLRKAEGSVA